MSLAVIQKNVAKWEPKRDRWGRPMIKTPSGKLEGYTRVTTIAKTLDSEELLAKWKMRQTAIGLVRRPDLLALASTQTNDKTALNETCEAALDAAASDARANLGTSLHSIIEAINNGEEPHIIADLAADVEAYRRIRDQLTITAAETFVVNDTHRYAGTFDFLVEWDGELCIGDLKTGSDLPYSERSIAVQLAAYAAAEHIYVDGARSPMPEVSRDIGLIIWLPVGEARAELFEVDLQLGAEGLRQSMWVREWRKNTTFAAAVPHVQNQQPQPTAGAAEDATEPQPTTDANQAAEPQPTTRRDWLIGRVMALKTAGQLDALLPHWPTDTPGFAGGHNHTTEQLNSIEQALNAAEKQVGAPFPPEHIEPQPAPAAPPAAPAAATKTAPDEGGPIDKETLDALTRRVESISPAHQALIAGVCAEAARAGTILSVSKTPTVRRFEIARALIACAEADALDDRDIFAALLTAATGADEPKQTREPGAYVATLTIDEARKLHTLAQAVGTPDLWLEITDNGPTFIGPALSS